MFLALAAIGTFFPIVGGEVSSRERVFAGVEYQLRTAPIVAQARVTWPEGPSLGVGLRLDPVAPNSWALEALGEHVVLLTVGLDRARLGLWAFRTIGLEAGVRFSYGVPGLELTLALDVGKIGVATAAMVAFGLDP